LIELLEPVVNAIGYELILLEYSPRDGSGMLRLFIDAEAGITLEDCEKVSREVAATLDVEDVIQQAYRLESRRRDSIARWSSQRTSSDSRAKSRRSRCWHRYPVAVVFRACCWAPPKMR